MTLHFYSFEKNVKRCEMGLKLLDKISFITGAAIL